MKSVCKEIRTWETASLDTCLHARVNREVTRPIAFMDEIAFSVKYDFYGARI